MSSYITEGEGLQKAPRKQKADDRLSRAWFQGPLSPGFCTSSLSNLKIRQCLWFKVLRKTSLPAFGILVVFWRYSPLLYRLKTLSSWAAVSSIPQWSSPLKAQKNNELDEEQPASNSPKCESSAVPCSMALSWRGRGIPQIRFTGTCNYSWPLRQMFLQIPQGIAFWWSSRQCWGFRRK